MNDLEPSEITNRPKIIIASLRACTRRHTVTGLFTHFAYHRVFRFAESRVDVLQWVLSNEPRGKSFDEVADEKIKGTD